MDLEWRVQMVLKRVTAEKAMALAIDMANDERIESPDYRKPEMLAFLAGQLLAYQARARAITVEALQNAHDERPRGKPKRQASPDAGGTNGERQDRSDLDPAG